MTPIRVSQSILPVAHRLFDAAAIVTVLFVSLRATPIGAEAGHSLSNEWLIVSAAGVLAFHTAAELTGLYRSWRGARLSTELGCILMTWAYALATLLGVGLLTAYNARFTYETKVCWLLGAPVVMLAARATLRALQASLHARGYNVKRVAVCGLNELGLQLARNLRSSPQLGLSLTGFYDDRPLARTVNPPADLGVRLDGIEGLVQAAREGAIDIVYIAFPMRAEARIRSLLAALADTTASVYIVPDFFVFELLHARWTTIEGLPAVSVRENPLSGIDGLTKRCCDLAVGTAALLVAALPMLAIALGIKLTSPGPIFFRQKRYGLDGREILVWKFRSMRVAENGPVVTQASQHDPRVTPLGRILRKTSLDELPQLFNVLGGSMSLVGPRPHATAHNEHYRSLIDGYMLRHKVKPGITGLAQVRGFRGETDTLDKMVGRIRFDHQYIREWSLWLDLRILAQTIGVVLRQQNAY